MLPRSAWIQPGAWRVLVLGEVGGEGWAGLQVEGRPLEVVAVGTVAEARMLVSASADLLVVALGPETAAARMDFLALARTRLGAPALRMLAVGPDEGFEPDWAALAGVGVEGFHRAGAFASEAGTLAIAAALRSGRALAELTVERQRAYTFQEVLQRERILSHAALDNAEEAILAKDLQGRVTRWNASAERMFGFTAEEMHGQSILRVVPVERREEEEALLASIREGRPVFHFETLRQHRDGRLVPVSLTVTPVRDGLGRITGASASVQDLTELRRAEAALQESRATLGLVLDTIPQAVFWKDLEGRYLGCNRAFADLSGLESPDAPLGRTDLDLAWPREDALAYMADDREVMTRNQPKRHILECFQKGDGERICIDTTKVPLRRPDGSAFGVLGVFEDVTERRRMETGLREALEFSEDIVRSVGEGIVVYGPGREVRAWNPYMAAMTGVPVEAVLGRDALEIFPWLADLGFADRLRRVLAGEEVPPLEFPWRLESTGASGWAVDRSVALRDGQGGIAGVLGMVRDTTLRRKTEMALRETEARFRTLFASLMEGVAIHDLVEDAQGRAVDYRILDVNPAFERHTGLDGVAVRGRLGTEAYGTPDAPFLEAYAAVVRTGEPTSFEVHFPPMAKTFRITVVRTRPGQFATVFEDITGRLAAEEERRRLSEQVAHASRMESLGSLASGVAHDINNVLGAIQALAMVHQLQSGPETRLRRDMDTISRACQRGGNLVKGLLGFARQNLAETRPVDLNALMREEAALLERTTLSRVRLVLDLVPGELVVLGDPAALSHSLMNLCVNAVDAMSEGGALTLATRNEGRAAVVEVADTGSGMPPEVLERAFDPFFSTKPVGKGTGLGLSIVYGTVKNHRGELEIHSEPGQGTRVRIRLPLAAPEPHLEEAPGSSHGPALRARTILLVDDDELILQSVPSLVESQGHRVRTVTGGEEALARLAVEPPPDLVILDMNMPGLDGRATLERLRSLHPGLPVLLATGRADQSALDLVAAHDRVALLPKPFGLKDLRSAIQLVDPE